MTTILAVVGAAVVGAIVFYLFLRANPKKAAVVNTTVNKASKILQ